MKLVNLTPHEMHIFNENDELVATVPPSGTVARVSVKYTKTGEFESIPLYKAEYGDIEGLPDPEPKVLFIVSGMVKAATDRKDVVAPGELIRDSEGKPIGCRGLKI